MDDLACHGHSDSQVEVHLRHRLGIAYHNVSVDYEQGTLTLYGRVASYYHKQLAQEAVIKLDHVQEVVNHIEVSA
jgi:osmotically-inducible protein OsmY